MKTVFLILFIWHGQTYKSGYSHINMAYPVALAAVGEPRLQIESVPSLSACEALGAAIKDMADAQPTSQQPVVYRCIAVNK